MSDKKEETKAAAERIKAQTLTAAKGLSRTQAERAATAAARNVNAYGQKEEGPSRWQEKREAKRQMYLSSTEKAVKLGERKSAKHTMSTANATPSQCQQCFQPGHWTYECKNERVYIARPSRTQQLKNPKLMMRPSLPYELDNPDIPKDIEAPSKEKRSKKSKRRHKADSGSGSDSEGSVFKTDSDSSSPQSSSSESSSSDSTDSEEERRRRRKKKKQKMQRKRSPSHSSSSETSESESDSDDDRKSRKKKSVRHDDRRRH